MKFCSRCKTLKEINEFCVRRASVDGHSAYCKTCASAYMKQWYANPKNKRPHIEVNKKYRRWNWDRIQAGNRRRHLKNIFGLSVEEYDALLAWSNNACAICGAKQNGKHLGVDHDHDTGKIRGILCSECNIGLGQFKDSPALLRIALAYLAYFGKT